MHLYKLFAKVVRHVPKYELAIYVKHFERRIYLKEIHNQCFAYFCSKTESIIYRVYNESNKSVALKQEKIRLEKKTHETTSIAINLTSKAIANKQTESSDHDYLWDCLLNIFSMEYSDYGKTYQMMHVYSIINLLTKYYKIISGLGLFIVCSRY